MNLSLESLERRVHSLELRVALLEKLGYLVCQIIELQIVIRSEGPQFNNAIGRLPQAILAVEDGLNGLKQTLPTTAWDMFNLTETVRLRDA